MAELTPMMQQYMRTKEEYKDCILMYRLGDFYEMFFDDALVASKELEITLTGRDCGLEERAPMCGVPFHAVDGYVNRLIEKGYKVAICEQMTDPAESKGLVEREVLRVITPGTVIETAMLDEKKNNYLAFLHSDRDAAAMAWSDLSTGEFSVRTFAIADGWENLFVNELFCLQPAEIQASPQMAEKLKNIEWPRQIPALHIAQEEDFTDPEARKALEKQFGRQPLEELNLSDAAIQCCWAMLHYLYQTQKRSLKHFGRISVQGDQSYMVLDMATRRNLELTETMRSQNRRGSLLWLLDKTQTAMGARCLRGWIEHPLIQQKPILERLDAVEWFTENLMLQDELSAYLKKIFDIERLAARIAYGSVNARDCLALSQSLAVLPEIISLLQEAPVALIQTLCGRIDPFTEVTDLLNSAIAPEPPISVREGKMIAPGYNEELDELRAASAHGKEWIAALEASEREETGIKNLKIGFNKVFGYYIEVTKSNLAQVPYRYVRKQTLANAERYITQELKEMEETILGAEEKSVRLEYVLFTGVRDYLNEQVPRFQQTAKALAAIDALCSLAQVAHENGYVKPDIDESGVLDIKRGRHPVVEKTLSKQQFVPNDAYLDQDEGRLAIITGPNMAGKSTFMRQVALIVLMAHIGSFVPAKQAHIGLVDRIFTRVGASDDLAAGQSTFMVEMHEMAEILAQATSRSLLILDEIGRGTSTFDGLSIAWAVVEHICDEQILGAKTLFATHYHELTELEGRLPGVKNYCVTVREHGEDIIFLRRIKRGGADRSFGIQVARLAGLPEDVLKRARQILKRLEEADINNGSIGANILAAPGASSAQIDLFVPVQAAPESNPVVEQLRDMDIGNMTPVEAIGVLYDLQQQVLEKE